jgi:hypothetical protein
MMTTVPAQADEEKRKKSGEKKARYRANLSDDERQSQKEKNTEQRGKARALAKELAKGKIGGDDKNLLESEQTVGGRKLLQKRRRKDLAEDKRLTRFKVGDHFIARAWNDELHKFEYHDPTCKIDLETNTELQELVWEHDERIYGETSDCRQASRKRVRIAELSQGQQSALREKTRLAMRKSRAKLKKLKFENFELWNIIKRVTSLKRWNSSSAITFRGFITL